MDTYIASVSAKFDAPGAWTLLPLSSGQLLSFLEPSQLPGTYAAHAAKWYVIINVLSWLPNVASKKETKADVPPPESTEEPWVQIRVNFELEGIYASLYTGKLDLVG